MQLTPYVCYLSLQLRNLVWATSKHDAYLLSHYSLIHWSALTCNKSEVLDLSGHVTPSEVHPFTNKLGGKLVFHLFSLE